MILKVPHLYLDSTYYKGRLYSALCLSAVVDAVISFGVASLAVDEDGMLQVPLTVDSDLLSVPIVVEIIGESGTASKFAMEMASVYGHTVWDMNAVQYLTLLLFVQYWMWTFL